MVRETASIPMFAITPREEEAGSSDRAHVVVAAVIVVTIIVIVAIGIYITVCASLSPFFSLCILILLLHTRSSSQDCC